MSAFRRFEALLCLFSCRRKKAKVAVRGSEVIERYACSHALRSCAQIICSEDDYVQVVKKSPAKKAGKKKPVEELVVASDDDSPELVEEEDTKKRASKKGKKKVVTISDDESSAMEVDTGNTESKSPAKKVNSSPKKVVPDKPKGGKKMGTSKGQKNLAPASDDDDDEVVEIAK